MILTHSRELESTVAERTAELKQSYEQLQVQLEEHQLIGEELKESEERWSSLVQYAPNIIFTVDRKGTILYINHTREGYIREQVIGTSAYDYIPQEMRETVRNCYDHTF